MDLAMSHYNISLRQQRWIVLLVLSLSLVGCVLFQRFWPGSKPISADQPVLIGRALATQQPIVPLPLNMGLNPEKVALGRQLFHDQQLSHDNSLSCNSCHDLALGGTDRRARSIGIRGQIEELNTPTVLNSGFNFKQFWDGRAVSLEAQIDGPINNPKEMSSNWAEVVAKLQKSPDYNKAFRQLYPNGLKEQNIKDAIATFERSLTTPNARFDRFLRGEANSLTVNEQAGYDRFKSYGCIACHQGVNVGGNMFQHMGVMEDYFSVRGNITSADQGRFNLTQNPRDRYVFKVPSLRNVALTAPYFHDGHVETLPEAVGIMARYQLGRSMPDQDVDLIVQFLKTLTGELGEPKP
jgi:cytochrome c peroxidase